MLTYERYGNKLMSRFVEEGLGEWLHLKFMQIETAFQEQQLQFLKINDNFMKIQKVLGNELFDGLSKKVY